MTATHSAWPRASASAIAFHIDLLPSNVLMTYGKESLEVSDTYAAPVTQIPYDLREREPRGEVS